MNPMHKFDVPVLALLALNCALVVGGIAVTLSNSAQLKIGDTERAVMRQDILQNREGIRVNREILEKSLEKLKGAK